MLRVLILSTLFPNSVFPTFGGFVERQTLGLAKLAEVEAQVVAPVGLPPRPFSFHSRYRKLARLPLREEWKGLQVHRPRFPILPRYGARWTARLMARSLEPMLRDIRKEFPFDVINADFFWPDGPAAMRLSRVFGVPFSITARGSDIQYWMGQPEIAEQILEAGKAADGLLSVSAALGRVMAGHGMPAERISTHYTGIDHSRFHPIDREEAKAKLGMKGPLILTAGALIPGKGQRDVIAALPKIPEASLLLVGDGPNRRMLEALVKERGLQERVRLLGNVPHADVATLMGAADVMVLPSRSEGLANVWVEALACGTPVVTCDVGGAREVIDRPEAGALVSPEPDAIANAVNAILADPPAQAAVRMAAERFSWEENSARLFGHLSRLAAREGASGGSR
jgi:glycosyltransferase involved in cell wall biosynthesis